MSRVQIEIEKDEVEEYIDILKGIQSLLEFMVEMIKERDVEWDGISDDTEIDGEDL